MVMDHYSNLDSIPPFGSVLSHWLLSGWLVHSGLLDAISASDSIFLTACARLHWLGPTHRLQSFEMIQSTLMVAISVFVSVGFFDYQNGTSGRSSSGTSGFASSTSFSTTCREIADCVRLHGRLGSTAILGGYVIGPRRRYDFRIIWNSVSKSSISAAVNSAGNSITALPPSQLNENSRFGITSLPPTALEKGTHAGQCSALPAAPAGR
jgi:hypothetical protein